jgi:hypothetical protein
VPPPDARFFDVARDHDVGICRSTQPQQIVHQTGIPGDHECVHDPHPAPTALKTVLKAVDISRARNSEEPGRMVRPGSTESRIRGSKPF